MLSDDVFRARLDTTVASLRYWVPTIADTATARETSGESYWKLSVEPRVAGACPFELMLRNDQFYDLVVDRERFEDRAIEAVEMFVPLVTAIAEGRVIQRRTFAAASGRALGLETIIDLGAGNTWRAGRVLGVAPPSLETLVSDRRYLPYRR